MIFDDGAPRYTPHCQQTDVLSMGLSPMDESAWIEIDNSLPSYHANKRNLRARDPDSVYRWTDASLDAQTELWDCLTRYLLDHPARVYSEAANGVHCALGDFTVRRPESAAELLWSLSLLVAEDLVLMQSGPDGYQLTAASLCSPSHWLLAEKVGRVLREIHDPVPGIHATLTPKIDRLFEHLRLDRPVQRFNWALQPDSDLFHDGRSRQTVAADAPLYYRVERQTLSRLPETGAVVFTIRVFLHPLDTLRERPGVLQALWDAIDTLPPKLAAYKGLDRVSQALARYRLT